MHIIVIISSLYVLIAEAKACPVDSPVVLGFTITFQCLSLLNFWRNGIPELVGVKKIGSNWCKIVSFRTAFYILDESETLKDSNRLKLAIDKNKIVWGQNDWSYFGQHYITQIGEPDLHRYWTIRVESFISLKLAS